jgi:putative tricarboxylic transport membrane protein
MAKDKGNLIAGGVLVGFGIYVISVAARLPYVSDVGPGPGFFPLWLGIGIVLFASGVMYRTFASAASIGDGKSPSGPTMMRSLAGWAAMMLAIGLLGVIGFALSFISLTLFLIVALDGRPLSLAVGVAVGLAVVFHFVFVIALDVSLPKAPWGF